MLKRRRSALLPFLPSVLAEISHEVVPVLDNGAKYLYILQRILERSNGCLNLPNRVLKSLK